MENFEIKKIITLKEKIELATTTEEIENIYKSAPNNSAEEQLALEKWNQLSKKEVELATTAKEARNAYKSSPDNSEARQLAFEKINSFFTWKK